MAYADLLTIQTLNVGDILTAACMTQVRNNDEFLIDPPVCVVFNSAATILTTAVTLYLAADSEVSDNAAMHSTVTNNTRITATVAGRYLLIGTVDFATHATGERDVRFRVNGTTNVPTSKGAPNPSGSQSTTVTGVRMIQMAVGDYVECGATQRSGGALAGQLLEFGAFFMTR